MTNFIETQKDMARRIILEDESPVVTDSIVDKLVSQVIKNTLEEVGNNRDDDSCECDNCHRWRRISKSLLAEIK